MSHRSGAICDSLRPVEIEILPFSDLSAADVYAVARLRQQVFVLEQGCLYGDLDGRDLEPGTRHVLLRDGGPLVGYLRLLEDAPVGAPAEWRIGRVLLAKGFRGRGLADGLVRTALEHCAWSDPTRDVVLAAQSPLAGWYAGFGFAADGPEFVEDGIPHTPMRLAAPRPGRGDGDSEDESAGASLTRGR